MRLRRGDGELIRVGHRGAAALEAENTLASLEAAVTAGVDAVEFDVLDLVDGPLVLAHSNDLHEVSHGAATGTVRDRSLAELREVAPQLPTLDEALELLAATGVGVHVDLKLAARFDEVAAALRRHRVDGAPSSARSTPSGSTRCGARHRTCGSGSRTPRTATASRAAAPFAPCCARGRTRSGAPSSRGSRS